MKILLIRHGDPDYVHDSLTETGKIEAQLLAEMMAGMKVDEFYVSPFGRARETAAPTLEKMGREEIVLPWLREFMPRIDRPDREDMKMIVWDWLPEDWTCRNLLYDKDHWMEDPIVAAGEAEHGGVWGEYKWVNDGLDAFLAEHGYVREGNFYRVEKPNNDTICFFCHFGVSAVMLSHLLGISPFPLWHGLSCPPTGVTTVYTEERRKGIASFRMNRYGEVTHLYAAGREPSFSARFCQCYDNKEERHD